MPNAPQPVAALRDRAERHVFATLGDLPGIDRRVLALLELAGADRPATARDAGLDEAELRGAACRARKALRRMRGQLAAGGRCEHAELLLSDRLDGVLDWREARWLDIHLDRCPRCREHEELLDEARAQLRDSFTTGEAEHEKPRPMLPPARPDDRAHLRVVPQPQPEAPSAVEVPPPVPAPPAPVPARRATAARVARIVAAVLVVAALVAAIVWGISSLGDDKQAAPWDRPDSPIVRPAPLSGQ